MKFLLLFFCSVAVLFGAPIVPADTRFGIYGAGVYQGVVGGIPDRSAGQQVYATDYGWSVSNTGAQNKTALVNAIGAVTGDGAVVHIPAGTYDFNGIPIDYYLHNRVPYQFTLKGAGRGVGGTNLIVPDGSQAFAIGGAGVDPTNTNPESTVSSLSRGSTTVTVADGAAAYGGSRQMHFISFPDEGVTPVFRTNNTGAARSIIVIVTGRSGNNLTLSQPLPSSYTEAFAAGTVRIKAITQLPWMVRGVGIEGIAFDCSAHTTIPQAFSSVISFADGCWLNDVSVVTGSNYALSVAYAVNCEVRHSEIIGVTLGSNHAGMLVAGATNCLFEDSFFEGGPSIEHFGAVENCVYGYNYASGILFGNHDAYSSRNLWEGNTAVFYMSDGYFAGSYANSLVRNWMRNILASMKRGARNYFFASNIVGTPGVTYTTDYFENWGNPNIGNESSYGTAVQPSLGTYWADYDTVTKKAKAPMFTLTTRTDDYTGVVTIVDSGLADDFSTRLENSEFGAYPRRRGAFGQNFVLFGARSGNTWPVSTTGDGQTGGALPALGSPAATTEVVAGPGGFQEKDLDVLASAVLKDNYYYFHSGVRSGEELTGGDTIPDSYYRSEKPAFFGNLTWPPYDKTRLPASETAGQVAIPAGYRYINGNENYLGGGGGGGTGTLNVGTMNVGTISIAP